MRYSSDHKQHTRDTVLAEAGKAIRKDGPHRVSVAAVMKRAGLTHGGFYAHFKSKDAMLVAAIENMFEASRQRWISLTFDLTPAQGIAKYVDWYLSKEHRDSREIGCAVAALSSDLPRLSSACQKAYSEGARRMNAWLATLIERIGTPDAQAVATSVFAELLGTLSLARAEQDATRSDAIMRLGRASVKARLGID